MAVKPAWTVSIPTLFSHCVCVYSSVFMRACFLADAQKSGAPLSIWEFGLKSRMWFLEQPQTSHSQRGDWRSLANWYSFSSSTTEAPAEEIGCSFFFSLFHHPFPPPLFDPIYQWQIKTNQRSRSFKLVAPWLASALFFPLTTSSHFLLLFDLPIQCFSPLSPPFFPA